jgi:hypothetical protein
MRKRCVLPSGSSGEFTGDEIANEVAPSAVDATAADEPDFPSNTRLIY